MNRIVIYLAKSLGNGISNLNKFLETRAEKKYKQETESYDDWVKYSEAPAPLNKRKNKVDK